MKFGMFYEHQNPKPWNEDSEHRVFMEALEQIELADRIGIEHVWEVEHHFLEEGAEQAANMMAMTPYPGFEGKYFSMPCRNVIPKPMQISDPGSAMLADTTTRRDVP